MRYAICNETFEGWEHARVCEYAASLGYAGLEMAPYTLAPLITELSASQRVELRRQAESAGLRIIGLHWLLARTEGFSITSPDVAIRQGTADYLVELARCAGDLGGELMVFGSPGQRRIPPGHSSDDAMQFAADTWRRAMPAIRKHGVRVCMEPLAPSETDFVNTCREAEHLIALVDDPFFGLHLDVKAMAADEAPIPDLIRRYGPSAGHFHANDVNRRGPGFGDVDFVPILQALRDSGYGGWVSVEVFDYSPDPETIASRSIAYLQECERALT